MQIETKAVGRAGTVELAEGVRVPKRFSAVVRPERADTLPYDVELMVGVENGRFVVDALTARRRDGGPPVTSDGLRDVPVASLLRQAPQQMLVGLEDVDDDASGALVDDVEGLAQRRAVGDAAPCDRTLISGRSATRGSAHPGGR